MDRTALVSALRAAGLPDTVYWVEGVHEPAPPPPDFLYLRTAPADGAGGAWETGACERGSWQRVARHDSEAAACAHLRHLLLGG
ncbi:hypothetical protein AB0J21_01065 [Streptomyces sp. NPDC049954]|uniref:hypothetical protein n=1 Tax=Streptomyces sp. NPDC049954 TaxID=3155779 RepID=UPI00342C42A7